MSAKAALRDLVTLTCVLFLLGQGCPPAASDSTDDTGGDLPDDTTDNNSGGDSSDNDAQALGWFDEAWDAFDEHYSYFTHKGVDWDAVRSEQRSRFAREMSADEFAAELNDLLQMLHDWHVSVIAPDGTTYGYEGSYKTNYPDRLRTGYTRDGAYTTLGDNVICHAWVGSEGSSKEIAHIVIDTLDTQRFATVGEQDIENLFVTYADATGMIIDIRANNGGNEDNAIAIASRFVDEPVIYGYVETRNGPGHDDRDPAVIKTLNPASGTHYDGPVACLIGKRCLSSAEWFTLMMRAADAWIIGDTTRGGSGNPVATTLSNGVICNISTWVAYTNEGDIFENSGIMPHFEVQPELSCDPQCDYVLEFALAILEE